MSRYIVLLGLLAAVVAVSADDKEKCPANEKWSICGTLCEPTCNDPHPNALLCPRIECTELTFGCRCIENYLRDNSGACKLQEQCLNSSGQQ